MKNCKELFRELLAQITLEEHPDEVEGIGLILLGDVFSISKTQIMSETQVPWSTIEELKLRDAVRRINAGEPVQYIAGKASFFKREFFVNGDVLIPRPETEELVLEVLNFARKIEPSMVQRILDVGTGSGCIPVTLAMELPNAAVMGTDVSEKALVVARKNVVQNRARVQLLQHDILTNPIPFANLTVVVSNPPYITVSEKNTMKKNVLDYEPHLALFVQDKDPLLFYKAISLKSWDALIKGGLLLFEINERFGAEVKSLLDETGYVKTEIVNDLSGKHRLVKGIKP